MKKVFTLVTAGALAAGALTAQAQVTVDGQLTAAELTAGNYVLLGKSDNFTFTSLTSTPNQNTGRPFGNNGLLGLYVANTASKIYIFLGGTMENSGNSFQIYLDLPGVTGAPAATFLPAGAAGTSFEKITRIKLDQSVDLALALRADGSPVGTAPQPYKAEGAVFTSATAVQSRQLTTTAGPVLGDGTALTLASTVTVAPYAALNSARMAYRNTTTGQIGTNPGNATLYNTATYGGVGSYGWEIELDRAALGATANGGAFRIFAIYNNGNGGYASGEFIPKAATTTLPAAFPSPNLGGADNGTPNDVDFGIVPGLQSVGFAPGASGVLSAKAADEAAVAMSVFPNPAAGAATVAYNVGTHADHVNVVLTDLLGREVRVLANGQQAAGVQNTTVSTADVAAGTYMVRVQVGDKVSTRKVVLL
ncbi:T9SS type A sorting domain-containing protein [Hymenobacter rubidus]|uniref:T9SS type A sorting domain-containing protein n=1 Tax=Hymenobacter rubidus TaxID=1441626 RepID=UPI00191FDD79|nr:T9SS type A sorting domain-containing protein [Hymenobacter rubidus]